ncbi:unnamed protein product [Penicillium olsonii]|nr:unnamed protein product [Penicillium olsonii]
MPDEKHDVPPISGSGASPLSQPAHTLPYEAVIKKLGTEVDEGLSTEEASRRLQEYGPNKLDEGEGVSVIKIFVRQVANAMMLVLILAMAVSFGIRSWIEGGVICAVIVLNIVIGFFQEYTAEKTIESLHSLSSPTGTVSRDRQTFSVPSSDIVPGDIVELRTGDTIPADIRLVEAKEYNSTFKEDTSPRDRFNITYSSSTVTRDRTHSIIISTGIFTKIRSIALVLQANSNKHRQAWSLTSIDIVGRFLGVNIRTPLQKKLSKLAYLLFRIAIMFVIIYIATNEFSSNNEIIIYTVTIGISMILAYLIVILTITIVMGTKRIVEQNVIIRKLDSLETLSAVTDIYSDKTGTLTQNKIVV